MFENIIRPPNDKARVNILKLRVNVIIEDYRENRNSLDYDE